MAAIEQQAQPAAELIELLNMQTGPASAILCRMADNANLSLVCSAFGRHNQNAMQQELREIRMTGPESVRMIQTAEENLPPDVRSVDELAQEITHKLVNSPLLNQPESAQLKEQMQAVWWRCEETKRSLTEAEVIQTRPLWQSYLHALNEQLTDAELPHGNRNFDARMQALKELCLRLRVMHRFNLVVRTQGLNIEDRAQILRCFSALQESQRIAAKAYLNGDETFAQALAEETAQASCSRRRFIKLENLLMTHEMRERSFNLHALWEGIAFVPPLILPPRTAYERSLWLRDPAHAAILTQIQHLGLRDITAVPEEIEILRSLRALSIDCDEGDEEPFIRLRTLPAAIGRLQQLKHLSIRRSALREIPTFLEGLPRLETLAIVNTTPLTVFPEGLARRQYGGFFGLVPDFMQAWDTRDYTTWFGYPADGVRHFAWLPRSQLTDIPFFLWFREKFSLPYLNIFTNSWITTHLSYPFLEWSDSVLAYLDTCSDLINGAGKLSMMLLFVLLFIPLFSLSIINLPFFVYNVFVNLAIEPIVTFVRENLLGYSPMTHIRDIPERGAV